MPQGRREQAIADRRRRVVVAASELIGEREGGRFSMHELARRSGVSLATPYNLFGSKTAVLGEVFARQIRGSQERQGSQLSGSAGARIEATVEQLVSEFARQPRFFRNLWRALASLSPTDHRDLIVPVSDQLLRPLVQGMAAEALIGPGVAVDTVATTLVRIFEANFEQWASQDWSITRLREQLLAGFSLCLLGLVSEDDRSDLLRLLGPTPTATPQNEQRSRSPHGRPTPRRCRQLGQTE